MFRLFAVACLAVGCGRSVPIHPEPITGGRYAAVGSEGALLTSPDGAEWTSQVSGTNKTLLSVATGKGTFVAVGAAGTIVTSRDGASWIARASGTKTDLSHVIFTGEKFLAVGGSWDTGAAAVESTDGTTWTALSSPSTYLFRAVGHLERTVIAAANHKSDLQTPALFTVPATGGTWTQQKGPDFGDSVTVPDTVFVIGRGIVAHSRDGLTWTEQTAVADRAIAWSGTTFVLVGEAGANASSTEGTRWAAGEKLLGAGDWLSGVTWGKTFVAVGSRGAIFTSPDGSTWTKRASPTGLTLNDVAYGP